MSDDMVVKVCLDMMGKEFGVLKQMIQMSGMHCDKEWCQVCPYKQFAFCNGELSK